MSEESSCAEEISMPSGLDGIGYVKLEVDDKVGEDRVLLPLASYDRVG